MHDIRLIALDLDGTVFDDNKHITPRTLAAIRTALDRGVDVIPATGRTLTGVPEEFLQMPGVRYALTSNGATVTELATGRRLVQLVFDPEQAMGIFDLVDAYDGMMSVFINGEAYTTRANAERTAHYVPPALRQYLKNTRRMVDDMHALMRQQARNIEKFSIMYNDEAVRDEVWQRVTAAYQVEATTSIACNLELNAPGVTKGRGLMTLAEVLGLDRSQVMACGDSGNDLAMLQQAGLGVAMGNADDEIKAAARVVTLDNNHDGVAAAIEKFVLQPACFAQREIK